MEAIRAFIAITLPDTVRQQLDAVERQVQSRAGEPARRAVRWVPAGNIHLTLKFLGEVSSANIQALALALKEVSSRYAPLTFTVAGLGAFPNPRRPRVIWVGSQIPPELAALQRDIEAETRRLGYSTEERAFSPHLTLGRVSQNARPEEVAQVAKVLGELKVGELGAVQVNDVELFRSDLRPSGAVYTSLYRFPLSRD